MNWEEKAADDIINGCITINTLKEAQQKAGTDLNTIAALIEERINQLIERCLNNDPLNFVNYIPVEPDEGGVSGETMDLIFEYASKSFWAGYTKGFEDREHLFCSEAFSNCDKKTGDESNDAKFADDRAAGGTGKKKPCQRANADKACR